MNQTWRLRPHGGRDPRSRRAGHGSGAREAPRRRLRLAATGGAFDPSHPLDTALAASGDLPHLVMPEPESARRAMYSSAVSALLHLLALVVIVLIGSLAKEAVEEVIPVTILNDQPIELPGSNTPAPIPKMLSSSQALSAAALATAPTVLSAVPAAPLEAPPLDAAPPTQIDVTALSAAAIAPTITSAAPTPTDSISDYQPRAIRTTAVSAPVVGSQTPTQIAHRTQTGIATPVELGELGSAEKSYRSAASAQVQAVETGHQAAGTLVATGVANDLKTGDGAFGDPSGLVGTVPCMQSAYVHRYKDMIEERTRANWELPPSATPDDVVTLSFKLDHAGRVTAITIVSSTHDEFGKSALRALGGASPFPPLDDNVRCLSEMKRLTLTFTNS